MKKLIAPLFILLFAFTTVSAQDDAKKQIQQLKIGDKAPASVTKLTLKGVNGYDTSLDNEKRENGLLVIFSCNTCPYVLAWEDRYNIIAENSRSIQIGIAFLNSNEAKRSGADSFEAMEKKAKDFEYKFPYLVDENHVIADAFGASKTPDVFLFDKNMRLVYKGAIDDNQEFENVDNTWLANAAVNLSQGEKIDPNVTKAIGCTIKRMDKVEIVTE